MPLSMPLSRRRGNEPTPSAAVAPAPLPPAQRLLWRSECFKRAPERPQDTTGCLQRRGRDALNMVDVGRLFSLLLSPFFTEHIQGERVQGLVDFLGKEAPQHLGSVGGDAVVAFTRGP